MWAPEGCCWTACARYADFLGALASSCDSRDDSKDQVLKLRELASAIPKAFGPWTWSDWLHPMPEVKLRQRPVSFRPNELEVVVQEACCYHKELQARKKR